MILLDKIKNRLKKIYFKTIYTKPFLYSSKFDFKVVIYPNSIVDENFYWGDFEGDVLNFFRKLIQEKMVIFDIGANSGLYSLTAAAKIKNKIKIFSFEPAETPFLRFKKNIEINKFNTISIYNMGVSDKEGIVEFNICEDDAYNSIGTTPMQKIKKKININVTNINTFCKKNNVSKIDILKMDTEGAEFLILKGGSNVFEGDNGPVLFCEYNRLTSSGYTYSLDDYENLLKSYGYKIFEVKNNKLIKFHVQTSTNSNIICLKDNHIQSLSNYLL